MDAYTVNTYADAINRSRQFVHAAIALKKLKAKKFGNQWMIPASEVGRFKANPFQITRKEMGMS